jgi:hypothetical protein
LFANSLQNKDLRYFGEWRIRPPALNILFRASGPGFSPVGAILAPFPPLVGGLNPSTPHGKQKRLSFRKAATLGSGGFARRPSTSCFGPPGRGLALPPPSLAACPPAGRRAKPFESSRKNRVGGYPLIGQPSSHTTVRTVRYTAVQWITCDTSYPLPIPDIQGVTGIPTVPICVFPYPNARHSLRPLGFHPTLLRLAGSHRFLPSSRYDTFHPLLRLPLFGPSRSVRSVFQEVPLTVLWPLLTSCTSAIHCCTGSCTMGRFVSHRARYVQDLPR